MGSKVCGFGTMVTAFGMLGLWVWVVRSKCMGYGFRSPFMGFFSRCFSSGLHTGSLVMGSVPRTPQLNLAKFMGSLEKPIELPN